MADITKLQIGNDELDITKKQDKMAILSYGHSTWSDFIDVYQKNAVVYCRASSNSNPATGSQTRMAFMAYVNNADNPTEVEFQYVCSVSSKTASQPVDQVFVYKLANTSGGTWTAETRNTYVRDSYIVWGGKDIVGDISPDDAGCTDEFGHNKLAFLPASCIDVAYSTDGGTTWTDYGLTDTQKIALVTTVGPQIYAGKNTTASASNLANLRGRIRIACGTADKKMMLYTALKKILINFSTNGANDTKVKIRRRTIANYLSGTETWDDLGTHNISGWPGWNSYPYSGNFGGNMTFQTGYWGQIEFEWWGESCASGATNARCGLIDIRFIGTTNWATPSEMAKNGRLYTIDTAQNATFPANVNVTGSLGHGRYTYTLPNKNGTVAMTSDIPSVPTVNNGTLTIQKNGTNVQTFTANQSGNVTANITVPTKTSDLTNDGSDGTDTYVESGALSDVAISGDYNDLENKPTIPTVGSGILTIQKNSSNIDTFSANATANKTINITVPTTAADVSALPASTKYGASISVSIDSTDYKITTTLKDQDGNTLGTAQVIDLPLESVVVNGSFDSTNKKIVLTLENGNTVDIPVGDLVAGLQTEITSSSKLASDLVDDTGQTNKFMTSAEKTKLSGIATGAEVNVQSDWNQTTTTADDYIKNKPTFAAVATSGSYNDLSNKPTIPTVNNATLTIQKNGTTVKTFTANASTNVTANIAVPTKTSDLTNDSGFIESVTKITNAEIDAIMGVA